MIQHGGAYIYKKCGLTKSVKGGSERWLNSGAPHHYPRAFRSFVGGLCWVLSKVPTLPLRPPYFLELYIPPPYFIFHENLIHNISCYLKDGMSLIWEVRCDAGLFIHFVWFYAREIKSKLISYCRGPSSSGHWWIPSLSKLSVKICLPSTPMRCSLFSQPTQISLKLWIVSGIV